MQLTEMKEFSGWSRPKELSPTDKVSVLFRDETEPFEGTAQEFGWNSCDIKAYKKLGEK